MCAFMKEEAGIRRHVMALLMSALRTGQQGYTRDLRQ
jgi:hypothetical protein